MVCVLLLVGGFVLMTFFFCGVIVIKTQFTSPSTGSSYPSWQQRNPWDQPEPGPFEQGDRADVLDVDACAEMRNLVDAAGLERGPECRLQHVSGCVG